jgi:hypothetical protein
MRIEKILKTIPLPNLGGLAKVRKEKGDRCPLFTKYKCENL